MSPAPVVEGLDVVEEIGPCLFSGLVHTVVHPFALQRAEEAFHGCIVIPGTDTVHAHLDAMVLQQRLIGAIRVLATLIGVVDQASFGGGSIITA